MTSPFAGLPPRPARPASSTRREMIATGLVAAGATAGGFVLPTRSRAATRATPGATPAAGEPFTAATELAVRQGIEAAMASTFTPAAMVHISDPARGEIVVASGLADVTTGRNALPTDTWRIASVTKTFAATVILQLVDEGLLGLDDTLEEYIPGIANGDRITIRQVLDMTAGIFDWITDPEFDARYADDPLLDSTPEEAVEIMRRSPARFEPGSAVEYSNSNYILLGLIIEQLTGQPVAAVIDERILQPLGLADTAFPDDETLPATSLRGYGADAPGDMLMDVTDSNPDVPWTSGAMISTLADMATWARALGTGELISSDLQAQRLEMAVLVPGDVLEVRYGLGIATLNGMLGHNGGIFGYNSWVLYDPDRDATLVIVTTRANNEGGSATDVLAAVAPLVFPERFPALVGSTTGAAS